MDLFQRCLLHDTTLLTDTSLISIITLCLPFDLSSGFVDSSQQEALLAGTAGIDVLAWNKRLMKGGSEGTRQTA